MCALLVLTAYQVIQARQGLLSAASEFERIPDQLRRGDVGAARFSMSTAQEGATQATGSLRGPVWWAAARLPRIGDDVSAVRVVASVTDDLAREILPPVIDAAEALEPAKLRPRGNRIAIRPIVQVTPTVLRADAQVQQQVDRVEALDVSGLVVGLAGPVEQLRTRLGQAAGLSSKAATTVQLLPTMLGGEEKRTYLVLFQNNAEVRATGGIPGALALVTADRGRIELVDQGTAGDLGTHRPPILEVTDEEEALFSTKLATYPADINFTPDFPRTAELARAMWEATNGVPVDGVVSLDPVALSYLLDGTGPVQVPNGPELTGDNAVKELLSRVYLTEPDPEAQNDIFAEAAAGVFDVAASGQGDPAAILSGLNRAGTEHRLLAWSADAAEQSLLLETALAGAVRREPGSAPDVGVFLNDGTGAKMQYYLDHRVDVEPTACNGAGRQRLEVTVTVRSRAPADAASLPGGVVGPREGGVEYFGVRPGDMRFGVHLYAPLGGWIDDSAIDGDALPLNEVDHLGHAVGTRTVTLEPGQTRVLTYTVMGGLDQREAPHVRVTPGVRSDGVGTIAAPVC